MLSLKQLKNIESQPTLFDESTMPILDAVNDEEGCEPDEASVNESTTDWYIPKKSYKQFFAEREGGKVEHGWDIPVFDQELPKKIKLNAWTKITDMTLFVSSHLAIVKKYNGNKRFKPYLERLKELKLLIT